jgi:hypothetical protein
MQEDFCWPVVIMDGEVERSLSGDLALLCDVIAAVGKSSVWLCGHHQQQVNREAQWPLRGLSSPVGNTSDAEIPLPDR